MGILGLSKLIADLAPFAIKESEIKNYFGKLNLSVIYYIDQNKNNIISSTKLIHIHHVYASCIF